MKIFPPPPLPGFSYINIEKVTDKKNSVIECSDHRIYVVSEGLSMHSSWWRHNSLKLHHYPVTPSTGIVFLHHETPGFAAIFAAFNLRINNVMRLANAEKYWWRFVVFHLVVTFTVRCITDIGGLIQHVYLFRPAIRQRELKYSAIFSTQRFVKWFQNTVQIDNEITASPSEIYYPAVKQW